jgi:asparagine synthase (glutamine-hydrolysing)
MCGICGLYNFDHQAADRDLVRRMNTVITHRGPDEDGFYFDESVGLGMRRLSIIDVAGGTQPVYNEDRSIAILFNGEIYGYVELRDELERLGHRFTTRSDTETIVHAYEEYGEHCLAHLVGMFAFAIWDSRKHELFLARDRLGEKPLFYTRIGDQFLFASEIKSLLQHPGCSREVSEEALTHYLSTMWISYPLTIFRDIHQLPPGHWMRVSDRRRSPSGDGVEMQRYWFPENVRPRRIAVDEAIAEFRDLFADAVRIQMRSDVPVGASLSAGMDSTSVVAYAAKTTQDAKLKTFAVGFEGADWDERAGARLISEMYGTEHFDISVSPEDVRRLLPRLVWHMDTPMGDGSIVPVYMVSKLARQHVTVMLNGAGGDELFGGYPRYGIGQVTPAQRLIKAALPAAIRKVAVGAGYRYSWGLGNRLDVTLRGIDEHYYKDTVCFRDDERRALTRRNGDAFARTVRHYYRQLPWADPINRLMFVDMNTYLSDDLLVQTDRMPMAVSLEGRLPFLDHRLVEWAMALPGDYKIRNGTTKYFLRRAMSHLLPPEIVNRPKRGFGPPFEAWLKAGLLDVTRQMLLDRRGQSRDLYDTEFVRSLLASDLSEHRTAQRIWMLLVLETWFRIYIDNRATSMPEGGLDDLL